MPAPPTRSETQPLIVKKVSAMRVGQVAVCQSLQRVRHRNERAPQPERRPNAHRQSQAAQRAPAFALRVLQHLFKPQVQPFARLRGGEVIERRLRPFERPPTPGPAVPRFTQESAQRHEHRDHQAEQAEQDGPDQEGGQVVKEFAELVNSGHA